MYAAFSTIASDRPSLSFSLPSSLKARTRFLWVEVWTRLLASHVLNLCIEEFIDESSLCPAESLLSLPIMVDNPISWNAREFGDPTPCLLLFSESNLLHSALPSVTLSGDTRPQLLHAISPDSRSVTMRPVLHA